MTDSGFPARRSPFLQTAARPGSFREIRLERRSKPRPSAASRINPPTVSPEEMRRRLESNAALLAAADPHLEWASGLLAELSAVVYLVDREGIVLWSSGPSTELALESGAVPGVDWSERSAGTNAAGSALLADESVLAVGSSQGVPEWHRYTAMAVPVHDGEGKVVGAVVAAAEAGAPKGDRLSLAAYVAFATERQLRDPIVAGGVSTGDARRRRDEVVRFRRVLDASPDATLLLDEHGAIVYANERIKRLLDYNPAELLGRPVEDILPGLLKGTNVLDRKRFFHECQVGEPGLSLTLDVRRPDGTEVPVEVAVGSASMREGLLVLVSMRDATGRKAAVRRLEIQYAVSRILAEARTLGEAGLRILESVARTTGWETGELWLLDSEERALRAAEVWCSPDIDCDEFVRETRALSLERGRSMAGLVWEAAAPLLIPSLDREGNFSRARAAARAGLRSAFGVPITLGGKVIGVFGFFSRKPILLDPETRRMLGAVGHQVGQFVERRRAEEEHRASEAKLQLVLAQIPLALWTVDERLTVTYCAGRLYGTGSILPARDYTGRSLRDILPAGHTALKVHEEALRGNSGRYDLEIQGRSFECYVEPLLDSEGRTAGAVSGAIDVTDLRNSQARLSATLEQLPLAVGVVDAEGRWTIANALMRSFVPGTVPSRDPDRIDRWRALGKGGSPVPPAEWPIARALRGERVLPGLEMLFTTDEGREIWTRMSAVPLQGRGDSAGAICTIEDIDVVKRAEEAVRESEERLRTIIESAPNAMMMIDAGGRIALVNAQVERVFGYARAELVGKRVETLVPARLRQKYREFRRSFLAAPRTLRADLDRDLSGRKKDGSEVPVEVGLSPVHTARGQFTLASIMDVTERRRYERRESALAGLSRILSETLDFGKRLGRAPLALSSQFAEWCVIDLLDASGKLRRAVVCHRDPARTKWAAERLTPQHLDAGAGAGAPRVISTGRAELYPEFTEAALRAVGQDDRHVAFLREIGAASGLVVPLKAADRTLGALVLVRCVGQDPFDTVDLETARELAERMAFALDNARLHEELSRLNTDLELRVRERTSELEEALREMNAFSYTIAHDLRAPLRAIASGADIILEERARLGEEAREWARRISQAANRLDALVTGLLEYSRLHRQSVVLGSVDWDKVVRDTLNAMRSDIANARAEIRVESPLSAVRGNELMLSLAFGNLVSNALKFVPQGASPQIVVRAERPASGQVRLWVEDQGIGIAPEYRERIFGVFERLHGRESYPGTGIGLAIVRRVVERMGGKVGVESEPGRGSRFFIELPEA